MTLEVLLKELKDCCKCEKMVKSRTQVMGENNYPCMWAGNEDAKYMFVGIAPGRLDKKFKTSSEEDAAFKYGSGEILVQLFKDYSISQKDVFITNCVKCNMPFDGMLLEKDIEMCVTLFLKHEIEIVNPQKIIVLGKLAQNIFKKYFPKTLCFLMPHPAKVFRGYMQYKDYKILFEKIIESGKKCQMSLKDY